MNIPAFGLILAGLVLFFVSLPLVWRKVPMNPFYGVRLRASFESEERWYEINEFGGRQLAVWSWLLVAAGIAGLLVAPEHYRIYAQCSVPVVFLALGIPTIRILLWSRCAVPPTAPPPTTPRRAGDNRGPRTLAERLRELEDLRAQGLISELECAARRKEILNEV